MAVLSSQVLGKARAYVDALCKLPRSQYSAVPSGHYGRDYNTLRELALESLPGLDERLLGKCVAVYSLADGREVSDASFIEIETYARQIVEQLATVPPTPVAQECAALCSPVQHCGPTAPVAPAAVPEKAYDVAAIRREYNQAYAKWSAGDDEYLRSRVLEGATIDDLVSEFGRQPGGIRSRIQKLGLDVQGCATRPATDGASCQMRRRT